jgi:phage terminase large subunit
MKSFEQIVLHPRCTHAAEEFRLYSYRVDRLTGDIMPDLVGKHDHIIDAVRYSLEPAIRQRRRAIWTELRV